MKNVKKVFCLLILVLAGILFGTLRVEAESTAPDSFTMSRADNYKLYGYNYIKGINLELYRQKNTAGKYVYCIERTDFFTKNTDTYLKKGEVDAGLTYILEHGFPTVSLTGNADEDYWITQTAVWYYLEPNSTLWRHFNFAQGTYRGVYDKDVVYINNLITGAKNAKAKTFNMSINKKYDLFTLSNDKTYYASSKLTVNGSGIGNYTVSFTSAPSGAYIVNENGNRQTTFKAGESFYVRVPANSVSSSTTIKLKVDSTNTYGVAYKYDPTRTEIQSVVALYENKVNLSETAQIYLDYIKDIITTVEISKIDASTSTSIAGATLVIKDVYGNVVDRWISDGRVHKITGLDFGTYTLEEVNAPSGYEINNNRVQFTLTEVNYYKKIDFVNYKKKVTAVNILKINSQTEKPLEGAVMVVKDKSGNIIDKWTTTLDYHTIYELDPDKTYYLSEISAPEGYEVNNSIVEFRVNADSIKTITFENTPELPKNPQTGIEDFIVPSSITLLGAGLGLILLKKRGPIRQF